jgi:uncharacterized protein (TIRG00374 family)
MVSLRLRLILFCVGLLLAAVVVVQVGATTLLNHLLATGWLLLPVSLVWGVVYLLNACAWYTMLGLEPARPSFPRTWAISITSFALNYITPAGGMGGEGYRILAVAPWLGQQRAVGAVVQYRLMFSLGHMLFVLVALLPGIFLLPPTLPAISVLILTGLFGVGVAWFLVRRHNEGILEAGLDLLLLIPGVRRLARRLEERRVTLRELDTQITTLYREHPGRFWRALGIEVLSRCVMPLELVVIFWGVGLGIRIPEAYVAYALSSTLINLFFFLPLELGAREGGLFLVFKLLGLGADHGVFAAVVTRLRELVWTTVGLGLLWLQGGPRGGRPPNPLPSGAPGHAGPFLK